MNLKEEGEKKNRQDKQDQQPTSLAVLPISPHPSGAFNLLMLAGAVLR